MRFVGRCYRAHDPAWSFTPLSGAGAAITGGRFNRKGEPTLYLSLDVMTSFAECTQGFTARLLPLTMCEYDVDCEDIADLRDDAARALLTIARNDLSSAWLRFQRAGRDAPSWLAADRLKASGHVGILVPSFAPGATDVDVNLVLWTWGQDLPASTTRPAGCHTTNRPGSRAELSPDLTNFSAKSRPRDATDTCQKFPLQG